MTHRRRRRLMGVGVVLVTVMAIAGFTGYAQSKSTGELPAKEVFDKIRGELKAATRVPLALPTKVPRVITGNTFYPTILDVESNRYDLSLDVSEDCQGAGACSFGEVLGELATNSGRPIEEEFASPIDPQYQPIKKSPVLAQSVELEQGIKGFFVPYVCGANCSTSKVVWEKDGYRYMVALKGGLLNGQDELPELVKMANSAIRSLQAGK